MHRKSNIEVMVREVHRALQEKIKKVNNHPAGSLALLRPSSNPAGHFETFGGSTWMVDGEWIPQAALWRMIMAKITMKELGTMELHEVKSVPCKSHDIDVMRVIGGWIYTQIAWDTEKDKLISSSTCFVPETLNVYVKTED